MTGPVSTEPGELVQPTDPEDLKIIALARAALARSNTGEADEARAEATTRMVSDPALKAS